MGSICPAIRGLLRYLYRVGVMTRDLSQAVLVPRFYALERLPCSLPWDTVRTLFEVVSPSEPQGRRDLAILWLLVSYGIRPGEIVKLQLDDIDWRNDTIRFRRSKAGRPLYFPLTREVGESILSYLRDVRPSTNAREIFVRINAPHIPLSRGAVIGNLVRKYLYKAGIETKQFGAGVIRHSLAVHLIRKGHSLKTITDVLGHRDPNIAYHYTKLATEDLHGVALSAKEVMP